MKWSVRVLGEWGYLRGRMQWLDCKVELVVQVLQHTRPPVCPADRNSIQDQERVVDVFPDS